MVVRAPLSFWHVVPLSPPLAFLRSLHVLWFPRYFSLYEPAASHCRTHSEPISFELLFVFVGHQISRPKIPLLFRQGKYQT